VTLYLIIVTALLRLCWLTQLIERLVLDSLEQQNNLISLCETWPSFFLLLWLEMKQNC
jgi:hypothetical protein